MSKVFSTDGLRDDTLNLGFSITENRQCALFWLWYSVHQFLQLRRLSFRVKLWSQILKGNGSDPCFFLIAQKVDGFRYIAGEIWEANSSCRVPWELGISSRLDHMGSYRGHDSSSFHLWLGFFLLPTMWITKKVCFWKVCSNDFTDEWMFRESLCFPLKRNETLGDGGRCWLFVPV